MLDFLSLGALVHRLDPGVVPFRKATTCDIHVSGGEYNCAANLSDCFGLTTGIASAMVDYPIGDLIAERVRAIGVRPFYVTYEHDGVTGPNMATVYSDRGHGVRAPVVFYNRANEAAARLEPGDFDWSAIFADGVKWFHSGGIFASLSETTGELVIEGMEAARAAGARVSFDLNYREKLWAIWGGTDRARSVLERIVEHTDVLICGPEDLHARLGIARGADVIAETVKRFPRLRVVASPVRVVHSSNRHDWSAAAWIDGDRYVSPTCQLDVYDRVGSGDAFASGLFYGLLTGAGAQESLDLGWAHGALVSTYPGDTTMATLAQVRAFAAGQSARIQR